MAKVYAYAISLGIGRLFSYGEDTLEAINRLYEKARCLDWNEDIDGYPIEPNPSVIIGESDGTGY